MLRVSVVGTRLLTMSHVTNLIIAYSRCDNDEKDKQVLEEINSCIDHGRLVHVEDPILPDCWFCNGKTLEANIAIGAFNHLNLVEFISAICKIDYEYYGCYFCQVIVKDEHDDRFSIVHIFREV